MTNSQRVRESAVMMSSTMPSAKYSCSGSLLKFVNGKTAIEGPSGSGKAWESSLERGGDSAEMLPDVTRAKWVIPICVSGTGMELSYGTRLPVLADDGTSVTVATPGGGQDVRGWPRRQHGRPAGGRLRTP